MTLGFCSANHFGDDDDDPSSSVCNDDDDRRQLREIIATLQIHRWCFNLAFAISQFGIDALNREIGGVLGISLLECFRGFFQQGGASVVRSQRSSTQEPLHAHGISTVGLNLRN